MLSSFKIFKIFYLSVTILMTATVYNFIKRKISCQAVTPLNVFKYKMQLVQSCGSSKFYVCKTFVLVYLDNSKKYTISV